MRLWIALAAALLIAAPAAAQTRDSEKPLEITADETLEWHRNQKQYIARGNAVAVQGDVRIRAETLTADYSETEKSSMDIHRLTAEGGVEISSQGNTATGAKAVYDVKSGQAVMTGGDLRLTSPDQTVTARDNFTYDVAAGRLTANGAVMVTRGTDTLAADAASALFATDAATGQRKLHELTADGHVVITTPTETVRGQRGIYSAASNVATLTGGVRIERGPNVLEGEQAEVNLTTSVSRMIGAPGVGGRVRGVFYPGSADGAAAAQTPPQQPAPAPTATPLPAATPPAVFVAPEFGGVPAPATPDGRPPRLTAP